MAGFPEPEGSAAPSGELPIRVLIVEDHRVVAEGIAALINHQGDMKVVGDAGSVAETFTTAAELGPDVMLLDFRLPDGTGAEAAAAIREVRPEAKLIFLTREDTDAARLPRSSPEPARSSTNRRPRPKWSTRFAMSRVAEW